MKYLLDTFCWIELLQGGPKTRLVKRAMAEKGAEILVSSVTLAETAAKFHSVGKAADCFHALAAITSNARVVEITPAIADIAGKFWAEQHPLIGVSLTDCIIAASAKVEGAKVLTGDRHFNAFPGSMVI